MLLLLLASLLACGPKVPMAIGDGLVVQTASPDATGSVHIKVMDGGDLPMPGVEVQIEDRDTGATWVGTSDLDGNVVLDPPVGASVRIVVYRRGLQATSHRLVIPEGGWSAVWTVVWYGDAGDIVVG